MLRRFILREVLPYVIISPSVGYGRIFAKKTAAIMWHCHETEIVEERICKMRE